MTITWATPELADDTIPVIEGSRNNIAKPCKTIRKLRKTNIKKQGHQTHCVNRNVMGCSRVAPSKVYSQVTCDLCEDNVVQHLLKQHKRKDCAMRTIVCSSEKCNRVLLAADLGEHLKYNCVRTQNRTRYLKSMRHHQSEKLVRYSQCEKCNSSVPDHITGVMKVQTWWQNHTVNDCLYRLVSCPNPTCLVRIPYLDLDRHLAKFCRVEQKRSSLLVKRDRGFLSRITCPDCLEKFAPRKLKAHRLHDCKSRKVNCKHCANLVALSAMESHYRKDCSIVIRRAKLLKQRECFRDPEQGTILCPLGCNVVASKRYLERHVSKECDMRFVTCSHKQCGQSVAAKHLNDGTHASRDIVYTIHRARRCVVASNTLALVTHNRLKKEQSRKLERLKRKSTKLIR